MYNDFPCYYVESKTMAGNFISSAISYFFVETVDYSETIFIDNGVYVTSPERTICDMILYDRHEYHLLEAIDDVYNTNQQVVNIEKLESMVDAYGIRERFDELKAESEDIWDY